MSIQNVVVKLKGNSTTLYTRVAALSGITAAVIGPFLLITNGGRDLRQLPWYIWTIMSLLLGLAVIVGISMFKHTSHEAEDISISPDRKK